MVNFAESKIRTIESTLNSFRSFIENSNGSFLERNNSITLRKLEFSFNSSISAAKKNGIDVGIYEKDYLELCDKLEEKNEQYIRRECISILEGYSERKLRKKEVCFRRYTIPLIHDPRRL
ncbi:MAG: hypothetical protein AABW83_02335 [Nanoarchaeota archaeon]